MQWICVHRHGTVHITILTHDLVGDRWLKCTRCVTSRVEPCIFESSGLTSSFCWVFCVEREHCFVLEIRWCNERIQLEWKCFTECGREHSSHGQRHKYEERCGFGRSFWCVTYLAFCIDLLYKTAIFGPFFDITPYHRSTIFLSLEQRNQIYLYYGLKTNAYIANQAIWISYARTFITIYP